MKSLRKIIIVSVVILVVATFAVHCYSKSQESGFKASNGEAHKQLELFAEAIKEIDDNYAEVVNPKKLIYGALKGMLAHLDDYSQFMEPSELEEIKAETKGEFGGVGIEVSLKDGALTVITPIVGTPADRAGIKPLDKITKINDKTTKNITLDEAVKEMRGKPGTTVKLTVWREAIQKSLDIPIRRAIIVINSVKASELLGDKTGYIRLIEFQDNTARDLDAALKKLEGLGMDALILDLRNNPGGVLESAVDVSGRFLPKDQVIVSTSSRLLEQNTIFKSSGRFTRRRYPIIVLVNDGSASASEIVAGAIQDNKRGLILGTKTYGKASVQTVIPLNDGSALRLTTAVYLTPGGRMIKGKGIEPDIALEVKDEKDKNKNEPEELLEGVDKKDPQLEAAQNLMKAIKIYKKEKE